MPDYQPSMSESRGGRRENSGRKPLPNGRVNRIFVFEPIHNQILAEYREKHGLADDSKAIRHLIESWALN